MSKLKPCPFCGTPYPYVTFEPGYLDDSAIIFCNACKISVKLEENDQEGFNDTTKRKAIEAWNRRASIEPERKTGRITYTHHSEELWGQSAICISCGCKWQIAEGGEDNFCPNCGCELER